MKENKYDNPEFFKKYSEMSRSKGGLEAAGEWSTLEKMLPDFTNKKVLDLGCGYGWHCIYAREHNASLVIGVDISERMLEVAKKKSEGLDITYIKSAIEDVKFDENYFDVVLSSLALHYISDINKIFSNVYNYLKEDGEFIFSIEHPIFTAEGSQSWISDDNGNNLYWPVDNYFYTGKREAVFLNEKIIKYHRTISDLIQGLIDVGFTITQVLEPMPTLEMIQSDKYMADEMRRPMMLLIKAKK